MVPSDPSRAQLHSLEEENRRLQRAVQELSLLNDLARAIGASLNSQEIMNTVVRRSLRAVGAEQGVITLVDEQASNPMKTLVRTMVSSSERQPFHLEQSLLGWMFINKRPLLISDPRHDDRFRGVKWHESIHSVLAAPLLVKSSLTGVLTVYNKKDAGGFTEEDQRLLAIIAAQSAQVVESARLYEKEQELLRVQEELRVASDIQLRLLPKNPPTVRGYDIAGVGRPAREIGGDYFDFIPLDEHRLALCVGDVSGKGLPAALLMSNLHATIRGQALAECAPAACLRQANTMLYRCTEPQNFATLFYAVLDSRSHELHYASAGHEKPFLFRAGGTCERLTAGGMVLSFLDHYDYEEGVISFEPGDALAVYSDGVTDAVDEKEQHFGEERLMAALRKQLGESAAVMTERTLAAVNEYAGDRPPFDDMTLVIIKRERS